MNRKNDSKKGPNLLNVFQNFSSQSLLTAQDIVELTGRFFLENFSKDFFFYFIKTDSKIKINYFWGAKEAQENNFE